MNKICDVEDADSVIASVDVNGLDREVLINLLNEYRVLKQGHFELLSSLHSNNFIQFNLFGKANLFSKLLAQSFVLDNIDLIFTRDTSAVRLATGVSEVLNKDIVVAPVDERSHPIEESVDEYEELTDKRILIVEDIITTSNGIQRLKQICERYGAEVIGVAAFINRGYKSLNELQKATNIGKFEIICTGKFEHYALDTCPICEKEDNTNLVAAKDLNKAITLADVRKRIKEKQLYKEKMLAACHV